MHDSFVKLRASEEVSNSAHTRARALKQAVGIAQLKYDRDYIGYRDLIDAKLDLCQAQTALINAQRTHFLILLELYRAVGGGWQMPEGSI